MSIVGELLMVLGAVVAVIGGIGLVRSDFDTVYLRMHLAGKASPVSFLVVALGAVFFLDFAIAASVVIAAVAMVLTLPVGVHLLFRAAHRAKLREHFEVDELSSSPADVTRS